MIDGAHREISSAAQPYVSAGADAGNTPPCDQQPGRRIKCRPTRPLCLLRRRRKYPGAVQGIPGRGVLLAQDVAQPQLGRPMPNLGRFPPDQRTDAVAAAQTAPPLSEAAGACSAVNQLPKSVVRQIRMPRSVGTGGGRPPPVTRWRLATAAPTATDPVQPTPCIGAPFFPCDNAGSGGDPRG
jgi:hypothetical protein